MFTEKEIEVMSLPYFNVISAGISKYIIQSKNTGHFWKITTDHDACTLMHKYHEEDNFHFQIMLPTVIDLILEIVDHDDYFLNGSWLRRKYKTKEGRYFDMIVQRYCFDDMVANM